MSSGVSSKSSESNQQLMVARSRSKTLQSRGGSKMVLTGEMSLYKYPRGDKQGVWTDSIL